MAFPQEKFNDIVDEITGWFYEASVTARNEFAGTPKDKLIRFHHSLGQDIRNEFGLWDYVWEPKMEGGVDVSPDHPDAVSMRIIETVWERVQPTNDKPPSPAEQALALATQERNAYQEAADRACEERDALRKALEDIAWCRHPNETLSVAHAVQYENIAVQALTHITKR